MVQDEWKPDGSQDATRWMGEIADTTKASTIEPLSVFKIKVTGLVLPMERRARHPRLEPARGRLSDGSCSGHPYKKKTRPDYPTIETTMKAITKYYKLNDYDSRIREQYQEEYTAVPSEVFDHNGVKIEGPRLIDFKKEFDKEVTDGLSMNKLTNMF
ncbi:hypothetical protein BGZ95_005698 [Linnemannia exigua]|uniref:Uncharacterized protein n=1 Tax=Linnemannia exigua TaxID=604196 RepID=A0AAD4H058_9FUNG|nr:hypothetical protein BGZ95_005698 [Linnemannia exigua]